MQFHRGRLIDHVHLRAADLEVTRRFYRAVLAAIGRVDSIHEGDSFFPPTNCGSTPPTGQHRGCTSLSRSRIARR